MTDIVERLREYAKDWRERAGSKDVVEDAIIEILRLRALTTPPADDGGLRSALTTIQAMIGNVDHGKGHGPNAAEMRGGMLNDIRDLCNRALSTPPTPDRIGKDAVREAEAWLRAISDWLLANDHDMTLPSGVLDKDPLDIADSLAALSATPAQEGEGDVAWLIERRVSPPEWSTTYNPSGIGAFSSDIHRAYRFLSEEAARGAMMRMAVTPEGRQHFSVSEHAWIAGGEK